MRRFFLSRGGAPAQAANTAAEELKDTNADGTPDARLFAGGHRYQTAELLAGRFADLEGGVSSVIIANGVSQVDAVAAAGLAGSRNAPVLLTRPASLPHNVARFISDRNVTNVTIVGGTAAVSAAVETALKGLASKPTVTRLAGANRFATAAMIGGALSGPDPTWCGSSQRAAILVNGRDAGMSDAVVAGPLAYRLGLPMLLTEADELPAETRKFLTDNRVERVVVIGGTTAVSAGVINALTEEVGVVSAPRIAGASAAATSVEVAKAMRGACKDELNVDPDRVALLSSTATADGIAAAPVLGRGLAAGGGSVPILLVGSALPAEVRDFLATTPNTRDGNKTHMNVVAVGGKAVVTDAVMTAAVEAAITGGELTAKISFNPATALSKRQFTVTFSDDVNTDPYSGTNPNSVLNPDLYRINGRRLSGATPNTSATDPNEGVRKASSLLLTGNTVTVTLGTNNADISQQLETGDVVEVVGGGQVGAGGDKRKLMGAKLTIQRTAAPDDTAAPVVEIVPVGGQPWFGIVIKEEKLRMDAGTTNPYMDTVRGGIRVLKGSAASGPDVVTPTISNWGPGNIGFNLAVGVWNSSTPQRLNRPGSDGNGGGLFRINATMPGGGRLQVGNIVEVAAGTFLDLSNRGNRLTRFTVAAPHTNFRVSNVYLGNKYPSKAATITLGTAASGTERDKVSVTALQTGIAAGSAGNGWQIFGYRTPTAVDTKPVKIEVDVDTKNRRISYTVRNGNPKIIDLAKAFAANRDFADNFAFGYTPGNASDPAPDALFGTVSEEKRELTGGKSAIAARVEFNDTFELVRDRSALRHIAWALTGRTSSYPTQNHMRVTVMYSRAEDRLFVSWESTEQLDGSTRTDLPTRSGIRVIGAHAEITNYHATTGCGPTGGTCAPGQTGNKNASNDLRMSIIRNLRPDPSLCPFHLGTGSSVTCPAPKS